MSIGEYTKNNQTFSSGLGQSKALTQYLETTRSFTEASANLSMAVDTFSHFMEFVYGKRSADSFSSSLTVFRKLLEKSADIINLTKPISPELNSLAESCRRLSALLDLPNTKALLTLVHLKKVIERAQEMERTQAEEEDTLNNQSQVLQTFTQAVDACLPYISEDDKAACVEKVESVKRCRHFSVSDIIALISLLVAIYFGILASRPSEQLDRIIAQNEAVISQQVEMIEQNERIINQQAEMINLGNEDTELVEVLSTLTYSIEMLSNEVESLRDQLDSSDNAADVSDDNTNNDGHNENNDAQ